jgi:hypothetical protein
MYLEIILWRMFARLTNGYYAMMQRSVSSLFWDLYGLVWLFWRDCAASSWRGLRARRRLRAATASVACRGCCRKLWRLGLMLLWRVWWERRLGLPLQRVLARALGVLLRHCSASVEEIFALVQVSSDGTVILLMLWNCD